MWKIIPRKKTGKIFSGKLDIELALSYGTTKVELGVQILDEHVLQINHRGHGIEEIAKSPVLEIFFIMGTNRDGSSHCSDLPDHSGIP